MRVKGYIKTYFLCFYHQYHQTSDCIIQKSNTFHIFVTTKRDQMWYQEFFLLAELKTEVKDSLRINEISFLPWTLQPWRNHTSYFSLRKRKDWVNTWKFSDMVEYVLWKSNDLSAHNSVPSPLSSDTYDISHLLLRELDCYPPEVWPDWRNNAV